MVLINCQIIFGINIWGHRKVEMRWLDRSGMFSSRFQMFIFFDCLTKNIEYLNYYWISIMLCFFQCQMWKIELIEYWYVWIRSFRRQGALLIIVFLGGGGWRDGGEYHRQKKLEIWRLELPLTSFGVGIWAVREGQWVRRERGVLSLTSSNQVEKKNIFTYECMVRGGNGTTWGGFQAASRGEGGGEWSGGRVALLWGEARWQWGEAIPAAHLAPLLLSWPSPPSPHLTSLKMF